MVALLTALPGLDAEQYSAFTGDGLGPVPAVKATMAKVPPVAPRPDIQSLVYIAAALDCAGILGRAPVSASRSSEYRLWWSMQAIHAAQRRKAALLSGIVCGVLALDAGPRSLLPLA
jgi:hypothetical protein